MTSQTVTRSNVGMTYGLIAGLAMIVLSLCLYLAGVKIFTNMTLGLIGYLVIILLAVMAGMKQRNQQGGYLTFAEALKTVFLVFVLAFLLQTIFNYVLFNYIDTSFRDAVTQVTMEKTEAMMRRFGAPDSDIEKAMESISSTDSYSIKNLGIGFAMMCIVFFLVSLIIAAIVKKNRPPFENPTINQGQ